MNPFSYGNVLTAGQWSYLFSQKQDALGYTPVNRGGDTMQGPLNTQASTSDGAGFSIPPGAAPGVPVDGQIWMTIFGLFFQIGGKTIGPIANGTIVGPSNSVVGDIPVFSTTGGTALTDSGISLASQLPNLILATPAFGSGVPAFRGLIGADLPTPQPVALGGVKSAAAPPHQFGTGVDTSGNPTFAQPAIGDVSGLAANMLAFLAGGTSAQLAAAMVDETGSGPLVFATGPTIALGTASTAVTQTPGDNSTKLATTAYVQAAIFATTTLPATRLATTTALPTVTYANGASGVGATLTASANGALTVDGVAANLNDVILVKNQASSFQNGIYTVTATGSAGAPFVLTRATYYNLSADIDLGDQTFVTGGATQGATTWTQNAKENPVIGTDPITFAQTAGVGSYTAGNGLVLAGTQFAIDTTIVTDLSSAQSLSNKTLVSPALSGVPTAPTAAAGTNSAQIASTAFAAAAAATAAAGTLVNVQVKTASGTYTPTAGASRAIVFVTGGGAGGTTGTGSGSESGGGAGATAIFFMNGVSAQTVTIGSGGAAGAAGGSSAFGTVTANGGSAAASQSLGGRGGTAANGTLNLGGGDGGSGTNATGNSQGGEGGASFWGGGGAGGQTANSHNAGAAAQAYGAGGGGGSYSAGAGGAGAPGVVLILEFK